MTADDRLAAAYDGDLLREIGHLLAHTLADSSLPAPPARRPC